MKLLTALIAVTILCSFKFNPMSQSIDLEPGRKSAQFIAENETNESMAIEFTVKERHMDEQGKESLPETKELAVFPPQVIIPPKEKRTIRVNWNGPGDLSQELAFRVIAEQLPLNVNGKKKQSGIQMLMRYMAALYVTPKNVEPKITAKVRSSSGGETIFQVKNSGSKHAIMLKPTVIIRSKKEKWVLKEKDLAGLSGENVLAGSERAFKVKTSRAYPVDADVTLKVEE
jgi:fimbrial chaperone protein